VHMTLANGNLEEVELLENPKAIIVECGEE
jgi:hypothetical protein